MKIANPRDFALGLLVLAFAILGLWQASTLPMGNAAEMQAGYFPRGVFGLLLLLGALCVARGLRRSAPAAEPQSGWMRAAAAVSLAVIVFALTLEKLGLVAAAALLCLIASTASAASRPLESLALALALAAGSALLFVVVLGVAMPIWPR